MMLTNRTEITAWLKKMKFYNYVVNDDLTVDVNHDVHISSRELTSIPVQFKRIYGDFDCSHNALTSLEGSPHVVQGKFNCSSNQLVSLKNGPSLVGQNYNCNANKLIDLHGSPTVVNLQFNCSHNQISTFEGCPKEIKGDFLLRNNPIKPFKEVNFIMKGSLICNIIEEMPFLKTFKSEHYPNECFEVNTNQLNKFLLAKKLDGSLKEKLVSTQKAKI